jgi:hypothetical protein
MMWAEGVGKGWGGLKVKGVQLLPGKGPQWMGIRHHEQNIGLASKWGFPYQFCKGGQAQIIDYVLFKYKDRIVVCR